MNDQQNELNWECVFTTDNESEASKINEMIKNRQFLTKFIIKSDNSLFGANTFSVNSSMYARKYSIYCDSDKIDEICDYIEPFINELDTNRLKVENNLEEEKYNICEEVTSTYHSQDYPSIPIDVRMNLMKSILLSFFPLLGFGTISAVLYANNIPKDYIKYRRIGQIVPILYYLSLTILFLSLSFIDPYFISTFYYFIILNLAAVGFFFYQRQKKIRYLIIEIVALLFAIAPIIINLLNY